MDALSLADALAQIAAEPLRFYVYVLIRPGGTPFYVGRGSFKRIAIHEKQARGTGRTRKLSAIRKIVRAGHAVRYHIDSWFDDGDAANARECELISTIGRIDLGTGCLTNGTDGGEGVLGMSPETLKRLGESLRSSERMKAACRARAAAKKGKPHSPEHRAAQSAAMRASGKFKEARNRLTESQRGRSVSLEQRAQISAANRRRRASPETKQKLRAAVAKRRDEISQRQKALWADPEWRAHQTRVRTGKKQTEEHTRNAIAATRAYWADEARCHETRLKRSESTRLVWEKRKAEKAQQVAT